jgi:hypothetical protein
VKVVDPVVAALRGIRSPRAAHGDKVALAVADLHGGESDLARLLLDVADRHRVEHEVFHVARTLAGWSQEHVGGLAEAAARRGMQLDPGGPSANRLLAPLRRRGAELMGRFHDPGLVLLADLRQVHRLAAAVSLDWEVLAQTGQAVQDEELLGLATASHPQTLRQMRWANAKLKELSPQVMVAR